VSVALDSFLLYCYPLKENNIQTDNPVNVKMGIPIKLRITCGEGMDVIIFPAQWSMAPIE
jgi:hypothetical protein